MDPRYWTKSVYLQTGRPGELEKVRSTQQAAERLSRWPDKHGEYYMEAVRVCRAVLVRGAPRRIAREAFILAALEAGIYGGPKARRKKKALH